MPDIDEKKICEMIRRQAQEQMPDAWPSIERSVQTMQQNTATGRQRKGFRRGIAATVAALVVLAATVFAVVKLGGLPGGTVAPAATTATVLDNGAVRTPTPFSQDTSLTAGNPGLKLKIVFFENIKDLVDSGNVSVVHVKLTKQLGSKPNDGGDPHMLFSSYEMEVVKSFQGSLRAGDKITVKTRGGASDTSWIEDDYIEKFTDRFEYVLFLTPNDNSANPVYGLASPLQGYVPLLGGKVSLNTKIENNGLFRQGETMNELYQAIETAVK